MVDVIPAWVSGYAGVPFVEHGRDPAGWDCWGLVRWCFREHFNIALPSFSDRYESTDDAAAIAAVVAGELAPWRKPRAPWRKLRAPLEGGERPRLGDVALLRRGPHPTHVGLVLDRRRMLHVEREIATGVEDFDGTMWRRRIVGIYRHRELEGACLMAS